MALYQEQLRCAAEIVPLTELFFREELADEAEAAEVLAEEHVPAVLRAFLDAGRSGGRRLDGGGVKALIKGVQQATGYKGKQLFMPIRAALTGQTHGPDLNRDDRAARQATSVRQRLAARLVDNRRDTVQRTAEASCHRF